MNQDGATWPSWSDPQMKLAQAMHSPNFVPAVYLIDARGRIRYAPSPNGLDGQVLRDLIAKLVREAEQQTAAPRT